MSDPRQRVGILSAEGHTLPAGTYFPVENPATGEIWAEALECQPEHIDQVVDAASEAYRGTWRLMAPDQRGALVARWAELIRAHGDEIADMEIRDAGHLSREALSDVDKACSWLTYYAGMADKIEGRSLQQLPDQVAYQVREPYGVVVGINPFNANPIMLAWKAGPALVAGNCFILKAPELTPMSSYRMAELALEAGMPPGVLNVVTGHGHITGPLLSQHPGIGALVFTGGPEAGREVIRQSAANVIPVALELGGKAAVIMLEDTDIDVAVPSILHSNFIKSGQSCTVGSRVFVPASRYDEFAHALAAKAQRVRVGMPTDPASQMSTMVSRRQRDRVDSIVQEAVEQGAQRLAGGSPAAEGGLAGGSFYQPTVLGDVDDKNVVARTETFGPVLSLMQPYHDLDEVLERANSLPFGLTAQVWGSDSRRIHYLARNLEAGTVWINTYRLLHPTLPYGGMNGSGYGRENGFDALDLYTRTKTVIWNLAAPGDLPYS
jgi:acyl-CoA reductase-like NAD-dependent aldehyde dehydrogenase